jgi:hypothetical protein
MWGVDRAAAIPEAPGLRIWRRAAFLAGLAVVGVLIPAAGAHAATITVTTSADDLIPNDGSVSLREAITATDAGNSLGDPDINAESPGTFGSNDQIHFDIPASGLRVIALGSALPAVTKAMKIDGTTQPGAVGTPAIGIALNGAGAGSASGIVARAPLTVTGLDIERFGASGVRLQAGSDNSTVRGNLIGTNPTGVSAAPNSTGVTIESSHNLIGGSGVSDRNVISGNTGAAVSFAPTTAIDNAVRGNFIGTDMTGATAVPNGGPGMSLSGGGQIIAGNPSAPQKIWFNDGPGISDASAGDFFTANSIKANGGGGITVAGGTPTGSLSLAGDQRTAAVSYSNATPGQLITAEFFDNPRAPGCPGQGEAFLGSATLTAAATGSGAITFTAASALPSGSGLTATLTDGVKGTSPFMCLRGGVPQGPPSLSHVSFIWSSFPARAGTVLTLKLSEPATITAKVQRLVPGRTHHGHCRTGAKSGHRCTIKIPKLSLTFSGLGGSNQFVFRGQRLKPGTYTATIVAHDAANKTSQAVVLKFRITRPGK